MDPFGTGLEHRLKRAARQIADQHRHLRPIRAELGRALEEGRRASVQRAFHSYAEALQAHFRLESDVFFPALHGLHPEFASELHALERDHVDLGEQVGALGRLVAEGPGDLCLDRFTALNAELEEHEAREERLVERIVAAGTSLGPEEAES